MSTKWGKTKITFEKSNDDTRDLTIKFKIPKKWRAGPVSKVKTTFLETFNEKYKENPLDYDSVHLKNSQNKDLCDNDIVQDVISTHDTLTLCLGAAPVQKAPAMYLGHKVGSAQVPENAGSTSTKSSGFNYSRFDNIDVSDEDEDRAECHPNIDVKSWIRLRKNQREENRAKERAEIAALEATVDELKQRSLSLEKAAQAARDDPNANEDEVEEAEAVARDVAHQLHDAEYELSERIRKKKLTVDELCVDGFDVTSSGTSNQSSAPGPPSSSGGSLAFPNKAPGSAPGTEPPKGHSGPSVPEDLGYEEYLNTHQKTIETFAHMNTVGTKSYEKAKKYLLDNPAVLSTHAVGHMLLICLDYQMADQEEMAFRVATQYQLVQFCLDLASSSRQDPRSAVHPLFQRIDQNHDQYIKGFEDSVRDFVKKVKLRAEEKRAAGEESPLKLQREAAENRKLAEAAMEAGDGEGEEESFGIDPNAPVGPGGLHPAEVFDTLPEPLQQCFISQDIEMIKKVLMEMKPEDARYHFDRCIASGLWNPNGPGDDGQKPE